MTDPSPDQEVGHADSHEDLSTPVGDVQVEPGAQPWTEDDDEDQADAES